MPLYPMRRAAVPASTPAEISSVPKKGRIFLVILALRSDAVNAVFIEALDLLPPREGLHPVHAPDAVLSPILNDHDRSLKHRMRQGKAYLARLPVSTWPVRRPPPFRQIWSAAAAYPEPSSAAWGAEPPRTAKQ